MMKRKMNSRRGKAAQRTKNSLDLNKQDSHLRSRQADSLTWSLQSEAIPRFGNMGRFDNQTYNLVQMAQPVTLFTTSNVAATFGVYTFTATNTISQFTSLSAVFDQYRIREIEVWISAENNAATISSGSQNLYSVIDYDDGNALSTVGAALAYSNVVAGPLTQGQYRKWRPHIAVAAYSGVFTSFKNEPANWLDVASAGVQHYGLKLAADITNNAQAIKMLVRVYVQFRNVF